jgi:MoaA/NifB/PqqE/SkfB family radical SAM enzyme
MKPVLNPIRPKMIVWQLVLSEVDRPGVTEPLSAQECLLVIDSIVRLSRPIVVFTQPSVQHPDLFSITQYAFALGLKVIIEVQPEDLNDDIVRKYSSFGPRIFRILIDDSILEDPERRYEQSERFHTLEQAVNCLRRAGLEIHLGATIRQPNLRKLAFCHDYAIRRSAAGFYCHFRFEPSTGSGSSRAESGSEPPPGENGQVAERIEALIDAVAEMKSFSPRDMYFSPQCVRYGFKGNHTFAFDSPNPTPPNSHSEWLSWCMGGKTFAYIDAVGNVQLCAGIPFKCGSLRENGYNFVAVWEHSEIMQDVRDNEWSCTDTRKQFAAHTLPTTVEDDNETTKER